MGKLKASVFCALTLFLGYSQSWASAEVVEDPAPCCSEGCCEQGTCCEGGTCCEQGFTGDLGNCCDGGDCCPNGDCCDAGTGNCEP